MQLQPWNDTRLMINVSTGQLPYDFIDLEIFPTDRALELRVHLLGTNCDFRNLCNFFLLQWRWPRVIHLVEQLGHDRIQPLPAPRVVSWIAHEEHGSPTGSSVGTVCHRNQYLPQDVVQVANILHTAASVALSPKASHNSATASSSTADRSAQCYGRIRTIVPQ